jgi:acetyl esterase
MAVLDTGAALRLQSVATRSLMALPRPVLRVLAGRPIEVEGQRLDVEPQLTLRLLALVGGSGPLENQSPSEARSRLTRDVRRVSGRRSRGVGSTDLLIDGADGRLGARLYEPRAPDASTGLLVYFHGGGFVTGDLDTHDDGCRFLAGQSGVRLLAIDYRRAPEHRFPAAVDDALAAFTYAVRHAGELGAEPERIGVGGDSAGGGLAAAVATTTAQTDGPAPAFQLLFYPWLDLSAKHPSYTRYGHGFYLEEADLDWYRSQYLAQDTDALDPRCSPLRADPLAGTAPAYVATSGFDPLRDEAEAYAHRLNRAGVPVALRRHSGLFHGFFNTVGVGRSGREALLEAAGALRLGLATPSRPKARQDL